ncbi:MAG: hypothetical protein J5656_06725 [Clostridia bacterium]|nr:hypothetical protein [Clostridia bacterium]
MNVKDLVVTFKANVKGLEKLKAFNEELKTFLELAKRVKRVKNLLAKMDAEELKKSIVEADSQPQEVEQEVQKKKTPLEVLRGFAKAPIVAALIYIGKTFLDVTKKVLSFIVSISRSSYELLKLNRNFGISTTSLQRFGLEAARQGVKMNDFNSAVAGLRKQSADILLGRGDISPYALLGINPHQDPEQILVQLQKRLRELPESIGTAFASDLGLSPDMINFVRTANFSRMNQRPLVTKEELKRIEMARNETLDLLNNIKQIGAKIWAFFTPLYTTVIKLMNKVLKYFGNASALKIYGWLTGILAIITAAQPALGGILLAVEHLLILLEDLAQGGYGMKAIFRYVCDEIAAYLSSLGEVWDMFWSSFAQSMINAWGMVKESGFMILLKGLESIGKGASFGMGGIGGTGSFGGSGLSDFFKSFFPSKNSEEATSQSTKVEGEVFLTFPDMTRMPTRVEGYLGEGINFSNLDTAGVK